MSPPYTVNWRLDGSQSQWITVKLVALAGIDPSSLVWVINYTFTYLTFTFFEVQQKRLKPNYAKSDICRKLYRSRRLFYIRIEDVHLSDNAVGLHSDSAQLEYPLGRDCNNLSFRFFTEPPPPPPPHPQRKFCYRYSDCPRPLFFYILYSYCSLIILSFVAIMISNTDCFVK
jgi:hypothetical protein